MPVKPTTSEYELNFVGGPAENQIIKMCVEPTKRRWFCRQAIDAPKVPGRYRINTYSWWSMSKPDPDPRIEVFEYKVSGHAPRKDGALLIYELVEDEDGVGHGEE